MCALYLITARKLVKNVTVQLTAAMSNNSSAAATPASTNGDTRYTDYKLISQSTAQAPDGPIKYNILKFHSSTVQKRQSINPRTFTEPVRLTRKNLRAEAARQAAAAALAASGGPTPGANGGSNADAGLIAPHGGGAQSKKNLFKKKTRQVFIPLDPAARQLKKEEALPWVLEDYDGHNTWVGNVEAGQSKGQYMLFVFAEDGFRVVPAHRWYKFQKKQQYKTLDFDQAEEEYQKNQKRDSGSRWLMKKLNPANPLIKEEDSKPTPPPRRKFRTVDNGPRGLFGDDDDEDRKPRRNADGEFEELDFEEEFADDEDGMMEANDEEEAKELEEKIKREMRQANKTGEEAEIEEAEDQVELDNAGKEIKKVVRHLDRTAVYDSDEDKNPYASSEESDRDSTGNNSEAANSKASTPSHAHSSIQKLRTMAMKEKVGSGKKHSSLRKSASQPGSRGASPGLGKAGRGGSPSQSRAGSPDGRGVSPAADGSRKRRHGDAGSGGEWSGGEGSGGEGTIKKIKLKIGGGSPAPQTPPPSAGDEALITEDEVAAIIKGPEKLTTKDLLTQFRPRLKADPRNKQIIMSILKKIATLSDGKLVPK